MALWESSNGFAKSPSGQHEKPFPMDGNPWEWICALQSHSPKKTSLLRAYRSRKEVKAKAGETLTIFIRTCVAELSISL